MTEKYEMISSRQEPTISQIEPRMASRHSPVMILSAPGCPELSLDPRQVEAAANVISTEYVYYESNIYIL